MQSRKLLTLCNEVDQKVDWRTMKRHPIVFAARVWIGLLTIASSFGCFGQSLPKQGGSILGHVKDPSGAMIPNATVSVSSAAGQMEKVVTSASGSYAVRGLAAGTYSLTVTASGFTPFHADKLAVSDNSTKPFDVSLSIEVTPQQVQVNSETLSVGTAPESNANALVIKGKDLDALSDDPDELLDELQALAGPAAGPSGGQIYIDGFSGGQLPPKSSIREIRVNQNPFSAQYDRLGYGRIEILTKPGSDKFSGHITSLGNDSAWNTANPLVQQQPSYYLYFIQ